jgi:hypothetical protein
MTEQRTSDETSALFRLKCAICGHRETLEVKGGDPDGPSCSKCYGPMTVEGVATIPRKEKSRG